MIFPVTNCINTNADYLVAQQMQEMSQNQIRFGSHTHTHPILFEVSIAETREEMSKSKTIIEKIT